MLTARDFLDWFVPASFGAIAAELARKFFRRRPRLVMWPTRRILFDLPPGECGTAPQASLFVQALFLQNLGGRPVTGIQIAHKLPPAHFQLHPVFEYRELTPPEGHIIEVANLGPRESITLYTLSQEDPQLVHVRSDQGKAEELSGRSVRLVTPVSVALTCALQFVGAVALVLAAALALQAITARAHP